MEPVRIPARHVLHVPIRQIGYHGRQLDLLWGHRMNLSDLATFGSFLSSLAVCASLVYLALQVRQSDRNQRTLLQQGTSERNAASVSKLTEPGLAELMVKAQRHDIDFTNVQVVQLSVALRSGLLGFQDQFLLRKLNLIDVMQQDSQERAYQSMLSMPAMRVLWISQRPFFAPEFVAYVDALIRDVPLAPASDRAAQFNADVAELTSLVAK
jgi:hypothetical protein